MEHSATRTILTVFRRELAAYFATPLAAIFLLVFLALAAGLTFFVGAFFERGQADLSAFFIWHPWLYMILMPAIGMRLWAEERRSGTIELLLTLPVHTWELVVGKFLAGWAFTGFALALTVPMWITVNYLGEPDNGVILAAYLGSFLMAGAFLGIAACLSAATENQVIAFIAAAIGSFLLVMAGSQLVLSFVREWLPGAIVAVIQSLSFLDHFQRLSRGVLEAQTLVFFGSLIVLSLWVNVQLVQLRKSA